MLLLCLGTGVGVTDRHSQCTHWLRNDTGPCMGCGGAGDRKGRPYGGECTPLKCLAEFAACGKIMRAADWEPFGGKIGDFSPGTTKGLSRIGTAPLNR